MSNDIDETSLAGEPVVAANQLLNADTDSSDRLMRLRNQYLQLTNEILPQLAQSRRFPVKDNHCFQRIILDNLFGCCWYEALDRKKGPAYKQLTQEQLEQAIEITQAVIAQPDAYMHQLNQNSLRWRGK